MHPLAVSFAEAGSTNPSPGEKIHEVDDPLVSRQRAVALALLRVPLLHCAICDGRALQNIRSGVEKVQKT